MARHKLVATYNFEPEHNEWLLELGLQEVIIPPEVQGPVLFSVTPTLDENGVYRGQSTVRCYEFRSKRARPQLVSPNDAG